MADELEMTPDRDERRLARIRARAVRADSAPQLLAAARWLDDMFKAGHLQPDTDWEIMHAMFEAGDAAMMITGPWALGRIRESGVPYAVGPIPAATDEGRPFLGVHGFMVSAFSEERLLAETFLLEFVATEETMRALYDAIPHASAFLPLRVAPHPGAINPQPRPLFRRAQLQLSQVHFSQRFP